MGDFIHDAKIIVRCFFSGLKDMFRPSVWRWMKQTKDEEDFTWLEVIGVVFWNEWRQEKHWRDSASW